MPKDHRLKERPQFDPATHCTMRCGRCGYWLQPFKLLRQTESSVSLNTRINEKTGWVAGSAYKRSVSLCGPCLLASSPNPKQVVQEALRDTQSQQIGLFGEVPTPVRKKRASRNLR